MFYKISLYSGNVPIRSYTIYASYEEQAIGVGDPRTIKEQLEENGIDCWLDIERAGKVKLTLHDL